VVGSPFAAPLRSICIQKSEESVSTRRNNVDADICAVDIVFGVVTNLSQRWQNGASESGKTVQELQDDFSVFAQDFSNALQVQRDLLFDYFVVNVSIAHFVRPWVVCRFECRRCGISAGIYKCSRKL
jgi:hypothetical protein